MGFNIGSLAGDAANWIGGAAGDVGGWFGGAASDVGGWLGGAGNALGISHPDNPAAARGTPRQGTAPERTNYDLGNDPNWLASFANGNQGIQNQAGAVASQGANLYGESQGFYDQAKNQNANAQSAEGRYIRPTQYDPRQSQAVNSNIAGGNGQYAAAAQLLANGQAPQGPSAAQAQLRQGTDQALKSQLALARSGSGFGENASALSSAARNAGSAISQQANNAAILKAQEDQAYRAQQYQNLAGASQGFSAGRQSDLGLAQQLAQQGQYDQSNVMNQRALNDQYSLGIQNNALQSLGLGLNAQTAGMNAQNQALAQQLAAQQLNLAGAQAQQQGGEQYENELSNIYGIDNSAHQQTRQLDQAAGQAGFGGLLGMASSVGGIAALSDRRAKKNVRKVDVASRYRDLARTLEALGG